ncbi:MAG: hypothetical protein ABSA45_05315 [Verrucomicrobiota bacterium]|jgi:hypothetical protein
MLNSKYANSYRNAAKMPVAGNYCGTLQRRMIVEVKITAVES